MPKIMNRSGNITPIHNHKEIPFAIRRVYYLYDVPGGENRGGHAHRALHQLIIAASGSFDVVLNDGVNSKSFSLNRSYTGLLVVPGLWRVLENFSSGAICLVLASDYFNESDYIRDFNEFRKYKG